MLRTFSTNRGTLKVMTIAVCPGSYDPVTAGHLDVIERCARFFDEVHVVVAVNAAKTPMFSEETRVEIIRQALAKRGCTNVKVASTTGLITDYCTKIGATVIVKGLRQNGDYEAELGMALVNRKLAGVETLFLPAAPDLEHISSSIVKDVATLYLDTSGEGLYKRGYRARNMGAPLRETLAAALVTLSRYRGKDPFCDPFCGSGTIPIEAALIAKNRAPGLDRSFAAQKWKNMDSKLWLEAGDEAMDKEFSGAYDIWGGDIDPRAIEIARSNAVKAGVEDCVRFEVADMKDFRRDSQYGQLVTNPPYGERLMDRAEAEELYRELGRVWRRLPQGWRTLVLSSHTEFERCFGRPADRKRKLYNGMIKCDVFMYGNV